MKLFQLYKGFYLTIKAWCSDHIIIFVGLTFFCLYSMISPHNWSPFPVTFLGGIWMIPHTYQSTSLCRWLKFHCTRHPDWYPSVPGRPWVIGLLVRGQGATGNALWYQCSSSTNHPSAPSVLLPGSVCMCLGAGPGTPGPYQGLFHLRFKSSVQNL